jgi:hypothetical protein
MDDSAFDSLTRRASLATLGAAGLAGLTMPMTSEAKKKKKKGDPNKLCKKQVGDCTAFLTALCGGNPDCQDSIDCCSSFATCNTSAVLACLVTATNTP